MVREAHTGQKDIRRTTKAHAQTRRTAPPLVDFGHRQATTLDAITQTIAKAMIDPKRIVVSRYMIPKKRSGEVKSALPLARAPLEKYTNIYD